MLSWREAHPDQWWQAYWRSFVWSPPNEAPCQQAQFKTNVFDEAILKSDKRSKNIKASVLSWLLSSFDVQISACIFIYTVSCSYGVLLIMLIFKVAITILKLTCRHMDDLGHSQSLDLNRMNMLCWRPKHVVQDWNLSIVVEEKQFCKEE